MWDLFLQVVVDPHHQGKNRENIKMNECKILSTKRIYVIGSMFLIMLLLFVGCTPKTEEATAEKYYEVKRGKINITVTSEGNLSMPYEYNLRFGTMGNVKQILVEEGDRVGQGTILAFLDNSTQKTSIKSTLNTYRTALYSFTSSCNELLPSKFPDISIPRIIDEAWQDLVECVKHYLEGHYREAGLSLAMAYFDIEICEELISTNLDASTYAGAKSNSVTVPEGKAGYAPEISENKKNTVEFLKQYRQELLEISELMRDQKYEEGLASLDKALQKMAIANGMAKSTVLYSNYDFYKFYDKTTSLNFLQSSLRTLKDLETLSSEEDTEAEEIAKKLYITKLNLTTARDILEKQTLLFHDWTRGFNWKTLQQYNLSLQSADIAFRKAKRELLNTVIVAPSNGTVVSVGLKENYILSAQDYSTRTAIMLVDTEHVVFKGYVDEIDIMRVQQGQNVTITVDAFPDKKFEGSVKFISPFGTTVGKVVKFPVTVEFTAKGVSLRGGLSATAEIHVYDKDNALLVPVSSIISAPFGSLVMKLNPETGKTEPQPVKIGQQSTQFAEVLEGLKEGDKILHTAGLSNLSGTQLQRQFRGNIPGAPIPIR